jgi:hypothetical protein
VLLKEQQNPARAHGLTLLSIKSSERLPTEAYKFVRIPEPPQSRSAGEPIEIGYRGVGRELKAVQTDAIEEGPVSDSTNRIGEGD